MNEITFQSPELMAPYPQRLLETPPFHFSGLHAQRQGCDAAATMGRWAYPRNKNLMILGERNNEVLKATLTFIRKEIERIKAGNET